jgi:hypothetical protein
MKCVICGSRGYDGCLDEGGDYVCVDCWANGEAAIQGRRADTYVPAEFYTHVDYSAEMQRNFVRACNGETVR